MPLPAPDPAVVHPLDGQERVVFLRPLVRGPTIGVGEHARAIMTGTAAELERIGAERGLCA